MIDSQQKSISKFLKFIQRMLLMFIYLVRILKLLTEDTLSGPRRY